MGFFDWFKKRKEAKKVEKESVLTMISEPEEVLKVEQHPEETAPEAVATVEETAQDPKPEQMSWSRKKRIFTEDELHAIWLYINQQIDGKEAAKRLGINSRVNGLKSFRLIMDIWGISAYGKVKGTNDYGNVVYCDGTCRQVQKGQPIPEMPPYEEYLKAMGLETAEQPVAPEDVQDDSSKEPEGKLQEETETVLQLDLQEKPQDNVQDDPQEEPEVETISDLQDESKDNVRDETGEQEKAFDRAAFTTQSKHVPTEEERLIIWKCVHCHMTIKDAVRALGYKGGYSSLWQIGWAANLLREWGIKSFENRLSYFRNKPIKKGNVVGSITYLDGIREDVLYGAPLPKIPCITEEPEEPAPAIRRSEKDSVKKNADFVKLLRAEMTLEEFVEIYHYPKGSKESYIGNRTFAKKIKKDLYIASFKNWSTPESKVGDEVGYIKYTDGTMEKVFKKAVQTEDEVLFDCLMCRRSVKESAYRLGYKNSAKLWGAGSRGKKLLNDLGDPKHMNNLGKRHSQKNLKNGDVVGYVQYDDGRREEYIWEDGVRAIEAASRIPTKEKSPTEKIVDQFLSCEISKTEAEDKIGKGFCKQAWFKEYLKDEGILKYSNKLDEKKEAGILYPGLKIGFIQREGHEEKEEILYTGETCLFGEKGDIYRKYLYSEISIEDANSALGKDFRSSKAFEAVKEMYHVTHQKNLVSYLRDRGQLRDGVEVGCIYFDDGGQINLRWRMEPEVIVPRLVKIS